MNENPARPHHSRIGIHYYPDITHYTKQDLAVWLPILKRLGMDWLTLVAPQHHTIPEYFLDGLINNGIEPVLSFQFRPEELPEAATLELLLKAYHDWGVRYVSPYDRPNLRSSWQPATWAQQNLVERFLDVFIPLAHTLIEARLIPIFPALEPGGDYWDTAFLRAALQSIQRRGQHYLFDHLVIGAYAWLDGKPMAWGAGGPERWPGVKPYQNGNDQEDHRGLYIFDWYRSICQSVIQKSLPIILLGAGQRLSTPLDSPERPAEELDQAQTTLMITRLLSGYEPSAPLEIDGQALEPIPPDVLACNFWLLATSPNSAHAHQSWFPIDTPPLPVVETMLKSKFSQPSAPIFPTVPDRPEMAEEVQGPGHFPIAHYLLLPRREWGVTEWHLEMARPYILKYHPTIGFSPAEAAHAAHVLVIGAGETYPEEILSHLRSAGSYVEHISGNGTQIATELANR